MGIDSRILVRRDDPLPESKIRDLAYYYAAIFHEHKYENSWPIRIKNDSTLSGQVLELQCSDRYFGPEYPRGPWPWIFGKLCWIQFNIGKEIYYGSDHDETLIRVTGIWLDSQWKLFCKDGSLSYLRDDTVGKKEPPMCCGFPMILFGSSGEWETFRCPCCQEMARI